MTTTTIKNPAYAMPIHGSVPLDDILAAMRSQPVEATAGQIIDGARACVRRLRYGQPRRKILAEFHRQVWEVVELDRAATEHRTVMRDIAHGMGRAHYEFDEIIGRLKHLNKGHHERVAVDEADLYDMAVEGYELAKAWAEGTHPDQTGPFECTNHLVDREVA